MILPTAVQMSDVWRHNGPEGKCKVPDTCLNLICDWLTVLGGRVDERGDRRQP